ncbi:hypothetical protein [Pseudomonas sp. PS01301]|uniref:hypothetical protein n=1 Tax=Pseudomonas sp. PS01301 TaxID=2991437 RepID=UPI00249A6E0A|nr:hypothetical protein [Pseudomonas sp. PS01301]
MLASKGSRPKIGSQTDTKTMYIGSERFKSLSDAAIKVSFKGGKQVTASQMGQYVLDNFLADASEKLLKEIIET